MFLKSEIPKSNKQMQIVNKKQKQSGKTKSKLNQTSINPIQELKKLKDEYMIKWQTYNISIDLSAWKSDSSTESPSQIYYKRNEPKLSMLEPEPYPEKSPSQDMTISVETNRITFDSPPRLESWNEWLETFESNFSHLSPWT